MTLEQETAALRDELKRLDRLVNAARAAEHVLAKLLAAGEGSGNDLRDVRLALELALKEAGAWGS